MAPCAVCGGPGIGWLVRATDREPFVLCAKCRVVLDRVMADAKPDVKRPGFVPFAC